MVSFREKTIGLDPIFKSSMKLKVKDIVNLQSAVVQSDPKSMFTKEHCQPENIFCYKSHVVGRVEVMGVIVKAEKYERCYTYTVDDGTGVIECKCWKNTRNNVSEIDTEQLPESLRKKYQELKAYQHSRDDKGYVLGDVILVRGRITVYRERKEIDVIDHRKVNNPEKELEAVLELPALYQVYNKQFELPRTIGEQLSHLEDDRNSFNDYTVQQAVTQYLNSPACKQAVVSVQDILLWQPVAKLNRDTQKSHEGNDGNLRTVRSALARMESSDGNIYKYPKEEGVYEIIKAGCPLAVKVLSHLAEESRGDRNAETGCSIDSMTYLMRSRYPAQYASLDTRVVEFLFSCLENNSDVIRVSENRYLPM